ncbi:MAG: hypothetical protein PVG14_20810, partial [Anaerolineales bacterium]
MYFHPTRYKMSSSFTEAEKNRSPLKTRFAPEPNGCTAHMLAMVWSKTGIPARGVDPKLKTGLLTG